MIHMSDQWECTICGMSFKSDELNTHYRLFHPDRDVEPDTWPDGELVVYEDLDELLCSKAGSARGMDRCA